MLIKFSCSLMTFFNFLIKSSILHIILIFYYRVAALIIVWCKKIIGSIYQILVHVFISWLAFIRFQQNFVADLEIFFLVCNRPYSYIWLIR